MANLRCLFTFVNISESTPSFSNSRTRAMIVGTATIRANLIGANRWGAVRSIDDDAREFET